MFVDENIDPNSNIDQRIMEVINADKKSKMVFEKIKKKFEEKGKK